jgi:AraC-like DNA-binding protein
MSDQLNIAFTCPFRATDATHVAAEAGGTRTFAAGPSTSLLFIARGKLEVVSRDQRQSMGASDALFLPPDMLERLTLRYETDVEYYALRFRLARNRGEVLELSVPELVTVPRPGRLTYILHRYMEEFAREQPSRLILYHLLVLALFELSHSCGKEAGIEPEAPCLETIASWVDAYIAAHYHEAIGTPDIASALRYNPDYLERAYHRKKGFSIREAIHQRRMKEAQAQLLLQSERRVAEIAALCGYNDAGYFRRVFKRSTKMTPRSFRANASAAVVSRGQWRQPDASA